jgi:hypothetical protein
MMRFPFCPHEEKIARMLRKNRWPLDPELDLQSHAAKCSRCADVLYISEMLKTGRTDAMMAAPATSPGYIWWRAQLRRQASIAERMTKPVAWAERLALAAMLGVVAGMGFFQRDQLFALFGSFMGISILAGLSLVLCVGGLTLLLSDEKH